MQKLMNSVKKADWILLLQLQDSLCKYKNVALLKTPTITKDKYTCKELLSSRPTDPTLMPEGHILTINGPL